MVQPMVGWPLLGLVPRGQDTQLQPGLAAHQARHWAILHMSQLLAPCRLASPALQVASLLPLSVRCMFAVLFRQYYQSLCCMKDMLCASHGGKFQVG